MINLILDTSLCRRISLEYHSSFSSSFPPLPVGYYFLIHWITPLYPSSLCSRLALSPSVWINSATECWVPRAGAEVQIIKCHAVSYRADREYSESRLTGNEQNPSQSRIHPPFWMIEYVRSPINVYSQLRSIFFANYKSAQNAFSVT